MIYPLAGAFDDLSFLCVSQVFQGDLLLSETLEENYRNFVYDHYTQVPADTRSMLNDFTQGVLPGNFGGKGFLYTGLCWSRTCEYTPDTGGSSGWTGTSTEYFLLENQRGYCMHFATAATLLLRTMGVPARYVEGYILSPREFFTFRGRV